MKINVHVVPYPGDGWNILMTIILDNLKEQNVKEKGKELN